MSLNKDKLIFDETDVASSDQVGSHLLGTANAKISSTNVGGKEGLDVNIISTITTQSAAEKAEDSAHVSGDVGSFMLAVRADVDGSLVSADGDYAPLQVDSNGRLKVAAEVTVEAGDAEFLEDSAHVSGDAGIHMLAVRQDTLASSVSADGDYASFKLNALGELYVHDTDVKAELVLANASLDAIETDVAAIETELIAVNSELDAQTALLTTIDASLDAIETSVAQIDIDTSSIITELQSVNTELDSQTALLTTIDADTSSIEAQIAQLTFDATRVKVLADINTSVLVADDATDTENPLKVGSRAVDGLLSAVSATGDKANVISDMYRRVYVNDAPNVGFKTSAASVTTTAAQLVSSPLLGRKRIMIQNLGNKAIFIGFDGTVSTANGLRVSAGAFLEMPFGEDLSIFAISESGTQDVRVVEIG